MPLNLPAPLAGVSTALKNIGDAWSYNGLTGGAVSGPGSFQITEVEGLEDIPSVRSLASELKRGQHHGGFLAPDFLDPRIVTMTMVVWGYDNATLASMLDQVKSAFILDPTSILEKTFTFYGNTRQLNCRCKRRNVKYDAHWKQTYVEVVLQLEAIDPRVYNTLLQTLSTTLPVYSGASFPISWPMNFGTVSSSGTFTATNNGNFFSSPLITVQGPVDNPTIENATVGKHLAFTGLTINAGDSLVIDTDAHSVLYYSAGSSVGVSRRNTMTTDSQWWDLLPGSNLIRYSANSTKAGSVMSLQFRDAWI